MLGGHWPLLQRPQDLSAFWTLGCHSSLEKNSEASKPRLSLVSWGHGLGWSKAQISINLGAGSPVLDASLVSFLPLAVGLRARSFLRASVFLL